MGKQNKEGRSAKKQEKVEEKSKIAKLEKYTNIATKLAFGLVIASFGSLVCLGIERLMAPSFFKIAYAVEGLVLSEATLILIILTGIYLYKAYKTHKEVQEELERIKENLMALLDTSRFKEIKLKKQDNQFFNAFLSCKVRAKINPNNPDIIIIKFTIVDDEGIYSEKTFPFQRQYIKDNICEVKDEDTNFQ